MGSGGSRSDAYTPKGEVERLAVPPPPRAISSPKGTSKANSPSQASKKRFIPRLARKRPQPDKKAALKGLLSVREVELDDPPLEHICSLLQHGLQSSFASVEAKVVSCPDLTRNQLAAPGLCGRPVLVDLGHLRNLLDPAYRHVDYSLPDVMDALDLGFASNCLIVGAGEAPCGSGCCAGIPGELTLNQVCERSSVEEDDVVPVQVQPVLDKVMRSNTYASKLMTETDGTVHQSDFVAEQKPFFAQFLASRGEPGFVLEITVKHRTAEVTFPNAMRDALRPLGNVGLGGFFTLEGAGSKISTLHSLPEGKIDDVHDLFIKNTLFSELAEDTRCFTTLISSDTIRSYGHAHTHCQGVTGASGGHWWQDTDSDKAVYHGYFVPAERVLFVEYTSLGLVPSSPSQVNLTVAAAFAERLAEEGVTVVFGRFGETIRPLVEAVEQHPALTWISTRHEGSASLMAAALAKLTGELQVCLAPSGPGALHVLAGLLDAQRDRVPVLAVTGDEQVDQLEGLGGLQDADQSMIFRQCFPSTSVSSAAKALMNIRRSAKSAQARSAVSHLSIVPSIQSSELEPDARRDSANLSDQGSFRPLNLQAVADLLLSAARPALFLGRRALEASSSVEKLLEVFRLPVAFSLDAMGAFRDKYNCSLGAWGIFGHPGVHETHNVLLRSDLVLVVGAVDLQAIVADGGEQVSWRVAVEDDAFAQEVRGSAIAWDEVLIGDIAGIIDEITTLLQAGECPESPWHLGDVPPPLPSPTPTSAAFCHPARFFESFNRHFVREGAVVSVDPGGMSLWTARLLKPMAGCRLLCAQRPGTEGYGLCGALAAKAHSPERRCAALCGDGDFARTHTELTSAVKRKLGILVVVFNNALVGPTNGHKPSTAALQHTNLVQLAEAYGGSGFRMEGGTDLDARMLEALEVCNQGQFAVLDVAIDAEVAAPFCK